MTKAKKVLSEKELLDHLAAHPRHFDQITRELFHSEDRKAGDNDGQHRDFHKIKPK